MIACLSSTGLAQEKRPHNQAEGDNPALDELVIQGIKKPDEKSAEKNSASNKGGERKEDSAQDRNADQAGGPAADPNWSKLEGAVEKLVIEFYPKAKIKKTKDHMHVEYKSRPYDVPSTHKQDIGPEWSGIVFDMELKQGPYVGVDAVPKKFNEYSYYVVELYAPYSKKFDRHLLTRISYPFDVPPDFLKRFKNLVDEFDQCL